MPFPEVAPCTLICNCSHCLPGESSGIIQCAFLDQFPKVQLQGRPQKKGVAGLL
jgi:hypothetical protein